MDTLNDTFYATYHLNDYMSKQPCLMAHMCMIRELPIGFFHKYNINRDISHCLGWTPAHILAIIGHPQAYKLVERGLDIHKRDKTRHAFSPVDLSLRIHGVNVFDPHHKNIPYRTPHIPKIKGSLLPNASGLCKDLLGDYSTYDKKRWTAHNVNGIVDLGLGMTATHIAAIHDLPIATHDFIMKGGDFRKKDYLGYTPLDYLKKLHRSDRDYTLSFALLEQRSK